MPGVLPPGTSGWLGSGFDCTCCTFTGIFAYDSAACNLTLRIATCSDIDPDNIELIVTGPDGVSDVEPTISGSVLSWSLYKPELGTWTAEATLTCPYTGETYSKTYTVTVTSIDTDCKCCVIRRPDFVTVNGTGCCAFANGTYVYDVAPPSPCQWSRTVNLFSYPNSPCPASPCFTTTSGTTIYYYFPTTINITVNLDQFGTEFPQVSLILQWKVLSECQRRALRS